jgi:hypothetical protein
MQCIIIAVAMASLVSDLLLTALRALVHAYDLLTWPIYRAIETPWTLKTRQRLGKVSFCSIKCVIYGIVCIKKNLFMAS